MSGGYSSPPAPPSQPISTLIQFVPAGRMLLPLVDPAAPLGGKNGECSLNALQAAFLSGAIPGSISVGLVAQGNSQSSALILTSAKNVFRTVAAGTGACLPAMTASALIVVLNRGASILSLYPPLGQNIEKLAANLPISIPPSGSAQLIFEGGVQWDVI